MFPGLETKKGFTLIEIVVAIILVLLISGTVAFLGMRNVKEGYKDAVMNTVSGLARAIVNYYEDEGKYPTSLYYLEHSDGSNWAGPYTYIKLSGSNSISLLDGKLQISYSPQTSMNTDCGYLSNRPAIIVYSENTPEITGLCRAVSGGKTYYLIP